MSLSSLLLTILMFVGAAADGPPSPASKPIVNGAQPVVSPRGDRIAFLSDRGGAIDLFVINRDGSEERQLTKTTQSEAGLQWSRDGKRIVFSVASDEASRLIEIRPDGTRERELGRFPGRTPLLAPDGKRIVFMAGSWTATRLTVCSIDGAHAREITDGSSIAWNSRWSPDGTRIAFTGRSDPKDELAVFVMNADGTGRRQVTRIAPDEGGAQWPVWSPDGRKLAAHDRVYLDETPSWFPDGRHLAFQSNRTGRMEVWVMNADGSDPRQVTGNL